MKRTKQIAGLLISIILLSVIGIIGYTYYAFNNYTYNDKYPVTPENLSYYSENYEAARAVFRVEAEKLKARFPLAEISKLNVPSA
ncbi:MAG TPA: hypothetical protein DCQ31_17515, partial [Bacteroidales bacterium]|nr:hypothetical protein [Bacteroidales bacterium]